MKATVVIKWIVKREGEERRATSAAASAKGNKGRREGGAGR